MRLVFKKLKGGDLKTITLNNGFKAIVDDGDYSFLSQFRWHAKVYKKRNLVYAARTVNFYKKSGERTAKTIMMHRVILKYDGQMVVDHKNHNGLDNRRGNLRICSVGENNRNLRKNKLASSRFVGVHKRGKSWAAQISVNGNKVWIGSFKLERDAAIAYNNFIIKNNLGVK